MTSKKFLIISEMNGKVLDVERSKKEAGTRVIMYGSRHSNLNQQWYVDDHGFIRSVLNDMVFCCCDEGKPLTMQPADDDPHKKWYFEGNKIMNKAGRCLDIINDNQADGAPVCSYHYKGGCANQHWQIQYL